jgi:CBS-domain-containing membrane protein
VKSFQRRPDTDLQKALDTMGQHQVHRLPVVDSQGQLIGILSMNNVTQCFDRKGLDLTPKKIVEAFKAIGTRRQLPEKNEQAISATV